MKHRFSALSILAALALIACVTYAAIAQEEDTMPARPLNARIAAHPGTTSRAPVAPLPTWNGSFVYRNHTYRYNMVGTAPSTGTSTTVPVFIVPVKLTYVVGTTTQTFSPFRKLSNGQTAIQNTIASPIFQMGVDFTSGGTDLGNTQYIDAFQRGNFWGTVSSHPGYHLLLGAPVVMPTLSLTVPAADGTVGTEFGVHVGLADINWFDAQLNTYMAAHPRIVPNSLPIFVTFNAYLTQGGCCIGGYHSATGAQSYAHFTYINKVGAFSQNVSALSHEVGEWADDPLVVNTNGNQVACGILETGDPEEGFANFGDFPYTLGGFTYDLQDLVFLPYFGAPTSTSVNNSLTFHGNPFSLSVCSNGG